VQILPQITAEVCLPQNGGQQEKRGNEQADLSVLVHRFLPGGYYHCIDAIERGCFVEKSQNPNGLEISQEHYRPLACGAGEMYVSRPQVDLFDSNGVEVLPLVTEPAGSHICIVGVPTRRLREAVESLLTLTGIPVLILVWTGSLFSISQHNSPPTLFSLDLQPISHLRASGKTFFNAEAYSGFAT
jgi:hypothetical protein